MTIKGHCFKCKSEVSLLEMYGHTICEPCFKSLGIFTDATIKRHMKRYSQEKEADETQRNYEEEMNYRLAVIKQNYISSYIKLNHLKDRAIQLKNEENESN